jgi:integrase
VPLPQTVADALAAHLARWSPHPELGVIFTSSTGGPVQQAPWASVWETERRRAGLAEWATPHDLRHHYASVLIRSGASVKVVQTRLGHASAKTTLDTYGHLMPDEEDRTRAAVDDAFAAACVTDVSGCPNRPRSRRSAA